MQFKLKKFKKELEVTHIANIHYFEFVNEYHTYEDMHTFCELVYVDSGSIDVYSENFAGKLRKNQMIIHKSNEKHSLSCMDKNAPNVIIIGFKCDCDKLDIFAKSPIFLNQNCQSLLTDIIKEGRKVFHPPYDVPNVSDMKKRSTFQFGADQMIKLKLETLLIELIRGQNAVDGNRDYFITNSKIQEIHNYLEAHYKESISLDELCFLYGTNKTTLCHSFKQSYDMTVIQYVNKLKISNAKKLLRESDYNLTQISEMVGFSTIHYFTRTFKNLENKTPSEYIRMIKSKLES